MRVLLVDVNCKYSSTGKIVYDLYTQLNSSGHDAAICYGRGPNIKEPSIHKISTDLEVWFHAFMTRITGLTGIFSPFATKKLIKYIDNFNPDVVHLHELHGYYINYIRVMEYLKENNIKTIWTFHCEFMYTGKCGISYDCTKWEKECGPCPHLKEYPVSLFFDFTKHMHKRKKKGFEGFDGLTIVTPSNWLAERAKKSFLGSKQIEVIHNGIDTEIFYPRTFEHLRIKHEITDEKIILAVAPNLMSDQKGGRYVLELAQLMKSENVKFILIGIEDLKEKFDDNIIALGRTNNQNELAEYYSMADAFVICSKEENFPTTCLEALACGTPVAGFDAGGTKETILDNCGELVKYADVAGLKEVLLRMLRLDFSKKQCAQNAKPALSKERMFQEYLKLYSENE